MFELLIFIFMILAVLAVFKALFFIIGLLFAGIGLVFKVILAGIAGVVFFPVVALVAGGLFTTGFIAFAVVAAILGLLFDAIRGGKRNRSYDSSRTRHRDYTGTRYSGNNWS